MAARRMKYIGEFARVFGKTPRNLIIEYFLEGRGIDHGIGEIIEETELNRATAYNTMAELIKQGYIKPTRKVSGAQLYTINTEKEEVKILIKVFNLLLKNIVEEYKKKEKVVA